MLYLLAETQHSIVHGNHVLERILASVTVQTLIENANSDRTANLAKKRDEINDLCLIGHRPRSN